jgi:hypothetical protein
MSGNIIGINKPLDNTGNTPLSFGNDFISSVYADYKQMGNNRVKPLNGMLVYNKIDNLVTSARVSPDMVKLSGVANALSGLVSGLSLDSI